MRFPLAAILPLVTTLSVAWAEETSNTNPLGIRAGNKPDVVIDLTAEFNTPFVISQIDSQLDTLPGSHKVSRTGAVQLYSQKYSSVPGPVKRRTSKPHKDDAPVIRVRLPIAVDACNTVHGHIVYYIFPDNSEFNFKATVDSWDTLTANDQLCQDEVNHKLQDQVPSTISFVQALIDHRLSPTGNSDQLPNEHFPSYRLLPAGGGGTAATHVYLILERSTIVSRWSDLCMDVVNNDNSQGAKIQQWPCYDTSNQRWDTVPTVGGYFAIRNRHSGRYLAIEQSSSANGAKLGQWDWNRADPTFEWQAVDPPPSWNPVGAKWLINKRSGKCIETPNWSTAQGTVLAQQDCVGGWKHYWYGL